jgi:hypothetical protein
LRSISDCDRPGFQQRRGEKPERRDDVLVEVRIGRSRSENPLEHIEHGQQRQQRGMSFTLLCVFQLARRKPQEAVEIRAQPQIALPYFREDMLQTIDLPDIPDTGPIRNVGFGDALPISRRRLHEISLTHGVAVTPAH